MMVVMIVVRVNVPLLDTFKKGGIPALIRTELEPASLPRHEAQRHHGARCERKAQQQQ